MKTLIRTILSGMLLSLILLVPRGWSDPPSDPPPLPGGHGSGGNQPPSGAPIGGGTGMLLLLGAGWAGMKRMRRRKERSRPVG